MSRRRKLTRKEQLDRMAMRVAFSPRGKKQQRLRDLYVEVHKDLRAEAQRRQMVQGEMFTEASLSP